MDVSGVKGAEVFARYFAGKPLTLILRFNKFGSSARAPSSCDFFAVIELR
jgi:hypothetical protein